MKKSRAEGQKWSIFLTQFLGKKGGHVYVCGDAKMMAKDVHNIIVEVVQKGKLIFLQYFFSFSIFFSFQGGEMSLEDAEKYVKKMEQQKRYSADVWS